jgi:hypothetical protein
MFRFFPQPVKSCPSTKKLRTELGGSAHASCFYNTYVLLRLLVFNWRCAGSRSLKAHNFIALGFCSTRAFSLASFDPEVS